MKGYKAFEKGLICKGKQYAENTVFEEETAEICKSGMHFCKNPLDVLDYYPLIDSNGNMTEFADVEALDECKTDDGKKYCTKKLKIGAKLSLPQFIKASFEATYENITSEVKEETKQVKNGGNSAKLAGGYNATLAGGYNAKLAGGYNATLAGGDNATLAGGNWAKLAGGYNAKLAGGIGALIVGDHGSIAKGKKGAVIVLIERGADRSIINYKAEFIDGEHIKEDKFYKLKNGEFVEV